MRDDINIHGDHYCGRCGQKFPEFMFHLAAGLCDDCYEAVEKDWEESQQDLDENESFTK